ncbi:hypothetical protein BDV06DRAFT_198346, partial [Aspergillus oleicola]
HLFEHLRVTLAHARLVVGGKESGGLEAPRHVRPTVPYPEDISSFGYIVNTLSVSHDDEAEDETPCLRDNIPERHGWNPTPYRPEQPLPALPPQTHSFNETNPVRILHRLCLEHIWRLFSDARSNPQEIYRVFRLVPCIKWREKFGKYLLCLVRSGSHEPLDLPALPFYCIGGAGTHYPERNEGKPVYPENMRLPRRILSTMVGMPLDEVESVDRDVLLKRAGLDGVWLDCRDVVGYIDEKGLLDGISSLPTSRGSKSSSSSKLDIHAFFQVLIRNMVILGRSPGFRLRDVEVAFAANIRVDST